MNNIKTGLAAVFLLAALPALTPLSAWMFRPTPELFYPLYGEPALFTDSYGWSELGKYTRSYGNNDFSISLETGYRQTLFHTSSLNGTADVRMILMNDFNPRSDWYFNPRQIIVDANAALYFHLTPWLSQSLSIHHDCKHDVDIDTVRLAAHDWLGVGVHMAPQMIHWDSRLKTVIQAEGGFNYFIQQLYDYLDRDHQQARIFLTLSSDVIRWQQYSVFLQTNTEVFISDKTNEFNGGDQVYTDFMGKAGLRFRSDRGRMIAFFAQWDYINDNLQDRDYNPGWYFSFGFSLSGRIV